MRWKGVKTGLETAWETGDYVVPWAAREQAPAPHGASRVGDGAALVVPATGSGSDLCEPTAPHPASSRGAKMHRNIPVSLAKPPPNWRGVELRQRVAELRPWLRKAHGLVTPLKGVWNLSMCVKSIKSRLKSFYKLGPKFWHLGIYAVLTQPEDSGFPDHVCLYSTCINQNRPAKKLQVKRCPVQPKLKCMRRGFFYV